MATQPRQSLVVPEPDQFESYVYGLEQKNRTRRLIKAIALLCRRLTGIVSNDEQCSEARMRAIEHGSTGHWLDEGYDEHHKPH